MLLALFMAIVMATNVVIFSFIVYYLLDLRARDRKLRDKEQATDTNYHHVVDEALSKERKILDDATSEADQIITGAQYVTHASKEQVTDSIQKIIGDIQKEGQSISNTFSLEYTTSLKELTAESLTQFQQVMSDLQAELKKQIHDFHTSMLPEVEKELAQYKQSRMAQIDQTIIGIAQKASQEILNKSLSITDHEAIVIESLEKAKKEGVFD